MEICSGTGYHSHDEVVYEDMNCPLCEVLDELMDKEEHIAALIQERDGLQDRIDNAGI